MAKNNLTVKEAAELMGVSQQFVRVGLQQNLLPFGFAVKISGGRYTYNIPTALFEKYTGITVEGGQKLCSKE